MHKPRRLSDLRKTAAASLKRSRGGKQTTARKRAKSSIPAESSGQWNKLLEWAASDDTKSSGVWTPVARKETTETLDRILRATISTLLERLFQENPDRSKVIRLMERGMAERANGSAFAYKATWPLMKKHLTENPDFKAFLCSHPEHAFIVGRDFESDDFLALQPLREKQVLRERECAIIEQQASTDLALMERQTPAFDGVYTCSKCKSTKTRFEQRQVRRADEPMTTFIECANPFCKHRWKQAG